ncbi:MAG: HAD hydrolase-like protein [Silicimonas sp.]|nr:HAD hydrolase-like protein [Silicimonas sp.]
MTAVFLDLDGTIMDSQAGIIASLKHAFAAIDRSDLAESDLKWMIGPPFIDSFTKIGLSNPHDAIEAYRVHYQAEGMFDAAVYPGITQALDDLLASDFRLYLATAKPHLYARKITAHFGIAPRMTMEFGPETDGTRNWKGDLLAHALEQTGEDPKRSVMVGDRHHDMAAAAEVGMPSIAVRWGYGHAEEWETAAHVIDDASQLPGAIAGLNL